MRNVDVLGFRILYVYSLQKNAQICAPYLCNGEIIDALVYP